MTNSQRSLIIERYTTSSGERRFRVHTAAVPVVGNLGETYRHADTGAIISLLSRLGKHFPPSPLLLEKA